MANGGFPQNRAYRKNRATPSHHPFESPLQTPSEFSGTPMAMGSPPNHPILARKYDASGASQAPPGDRRRLGPSENPWGNGHWFHWSIGNRWFFIAIWNGDKWMYWTIFWRFPYFWREMLIHPWWWMDKLLLGMKHGKSLNPELSIAKIINGNVPAKPCFDCRRVLIIHD